MIHSTCFCMGKYVENLTKSRNHCEPCIWSICTKKLELFYDTRCCIMIVWFHQDVENDWEHSLIWRSTKEGWKRRKFTPEKISFSIFKAAVACGGKDFNTAQKLTNEVIRLANEKFSDQIPACRTNPGPCESVLIENGHAQTAKAYILYREKRKGAREINALIGATHQHVHDYLGENDWQSPRKRQHPKKRQWLEQLCP